MSKNVLFQQLLAETRYALRSLQATNTTENLTTHKLKPLKKQPAKTTYKVASCNQKTQKATAYYQGKFCCALQNSVNSKNIVKILILGLQKQSQKKKKQFFELMKILPNSRNILKNIISPLLDFNTVKLCTLEFDKNPTTFNNRYTIL